MLQYFQSDDFNEEVLLDFYIHTFNVPGPHQFLT